MKKIIITCTLILLFSFNAFTETLNDADDPIEILFIGSSYFLYNHMTDLFKLFADSTGKQVLVEMHTTGGPYLADHASSTSTEYKIYSRKWDYIILQGVGSLTAYPDSYTAKPVYPALLKLKNKILGHYNKTKIVFCMPWAFEDGMIWLEGWTDLYADMQLKIYNNTLSWINKLDIITAPVGWAWNTVLAEKNYPLHYLHITDWNHPSFRGTYLMASVIYSTIFQSAINYPWYSNLDEAEAKYFQETASNTVMDDLELWNIIDEPLSIGKAIVVPERFHLYQNYPNPFNSQTSIRYSVLSPSHIKLDILNSRGRLIKTLNDGFHLAGEHKVDFNAENFSSGVYICRLSGGDISQSMRILYIK